MIFEIVAAEQPYLSTALPACYKHEDDFLRWAARKCTRCRISYIGWVNLTYVCRHWREVAIATPSLWTVLSNFMSPLIAEVFIARSSDLHLSLLWDQETYKDFWVPDLTLRCVLRLACLRVKKLVVPLSAIVTKPQAPFVEFPPRNVQWLEIDWGLESSGGTWDSFTILNLTGLRELTVKSPQSIGTAAWHEAVTQLSALHALTIESPDLTADFFDDVQALKSLETLRLHSLSSSNRMLLHEQQVHSIELASCRNINLQGGEHAIASILGILRPRPGVRLQVHASLYNEPYGVSFLPAVSPAIYAHFGGQGHDTIGPYLSAVFEHSLS